MADQQLVSDANREFMEDVSPSRLQHLISELFRLMLGRRDDMALKTSFGKKLKVYAKKWHVPLSNHDDDLEDKLLVDLKDREIERLRLEDD
jgi:hypothetical protein